MSHEFASLPADPYWRLRPAPPTPDSEICQCDSVRQVMLRDSLGPNPLYCVACRGEVAPERIGFDARLAEDMACWRSVHRSLYLLWLDSGQYAIWAANQLRDPAGSVNVRGRDIVRRLNEIVRAYYWWFNDVDDAEYIPSDLCPVCRSDLVAWPDRVVASSCLK